MRAVRHPGGSVMRKSVTAVMLAGVVALGGVAYSAANPAGRTEPAAPKWEYKVVRAGQLAQPAPSGDALTDALNKLGDDGWELVGVVPDATPAMPSPPRDRGFGQPVPSGSVDPAAMWDRLAQGKDRINLNDPQFAFMKGMMERRGEAVPADGVLTKEQFITSTKQWGRPLALAGPTYYFKRPKR